MNFRGFDVYLIGSTSRISGRKPGALSSRIGWNMLILDGGMRPKKEIVSTESKKHMCHGQTMIYGCGHSSKIGILVFNGCMNPP